jgi:hypothetical protein
LRAEGRRAHRKGPRQRRVTMKNVVQGSIGRAKDDPFTIADCVWSWLFRQTFELGPRCVPERYCWPHPYLTCSSLSFLSIAVRFPFISNSTVSSNLEEGTLTFMPPLQLQFSNLTISTRGTGPCVCRSAVASSFHSWKGPKTLPLQTTMQAPVWSTQRQPHQPTQSTCILPQSQRAIAFLPENEPSCLELERSRRLSENLSGSAACPPVSNVNTAPNVLQQLDR